ncbi:MAG: flagellar hook-associated protein 3 [Desulfobacterium sp. 4572_20]|nr:MAG: flagellar hook-associated protein 3 [Desulfobacterium sp. 4572_20]
MRLTNRLMADTVLNSLYKNTQQLLKLQEMVSSQKRINRPSDDPIGMRKILDYRKVLSSIDQYNTNITHGNTQIDLTESCLEAIDDLVLKARRIAVEQSAGELENRPTAAQEVKNIYDQILQLANTKLGDTYILSGHQTDTAPFSRDADYNATYHGDDGDKRIIVGDNLNIKINVTGEDALRSGVDVFDSLRDLINGLEDPDTTAGTAQIATQITPLSNALDQIKAVRSEAASTFIQLETTGNQLANFKLNIEDMLSDTEDANMAQAIVELQVQQTAYETSLATAAKILQRSLMDFLR